MTPHDMKYSTNDNRKAITVSFSDRLNIYKVVVPIVKRRSRLKKIDKLIVPLHSVQLRWVLFSRSRKEMVTFVNLRQLQISSNSVSFSLELEMGNST